MMPGGMMARKDLPCAECGAMMWRGSNSAPGGVAKCMPCRRVHGSQGMYRRGCRCDVCKDGNAVRMRAYVAKRRARDGVNPTTAIKRRRRGVDPLLKPDCFVCGVPLTVVRDPGNERPMHSRCRWSIPEWQRKPGGTSPGRKRFLARAARATEGKPAGGRVFVQGPCEWCAESFCSAAGKYCSTRCRKRSAEARKRPLAFNPTPRLRHEVYERDGWMCGLCDLPIDEALSWPDKWSASLDHIIPQSLMLIPDHSAQNLRAAHLQCNAMRGNGSNMPEDELRRRATESLGVS